MGHNDKPQLTIMPTKQCNMHCIYSLTNARENEATSRIGESFARAIIKEYFILLRSSLDPVLWGR